MSHSWTDSVVLIESSDPGEKRFGTGFVINNDQQTTWILTCAHVVRDIGGPEKIAIGETQARVIASSPEEGADLAVLRVERRLDMPALPLYDAGQRGKTFSTAGFHADGKPLLIRDLQGTLGKRVEIQMRGKADRRIRAWDLEITDKYLLQPGYSGSPIVDAYKRAIGVVSTRRGEGRTGIAISIEALKQVWPDMPPGLLKDTDSLKHRRISSLTFPMNLLAQDERQRTVQTEQVRLQSIASQAVISPQRSIMLPPPLLARVSQRLRLPSIGVLLLFILLVSLGIYGFATNHLPWSTPLRPLPNKTVPLPASAIGQIWLTQNSGTSSDLSGIAWSSSRFVAVGGSCKLFFLICSGIILTSPDAITWTSQNSSTSQHLSSVAWSGSRFVIVGDNGTVLTSSDGITWTSQNSGITGDLSGVTWSDSRFVAVGGSCRLFSFFCSDTIFTSPDGITWTSQHTPTDQHLHSVAWSGPRFVAVGNSGTIFTSLDGTTWTSQSSGTAVDLLSVVWSGSRFVIVGDNGTILTSSDGVTWIPQHPPTIKNLEGVVWSDSRFVVIGNSGTILTSPDGIAWTSQNSGTSQDLDNIVWGGSRFVTVGVSGVISTSP